MLTSHAPSAALTNICPTAAVLREYDVTVSQRARLSEDWGSHPVPSHARLYPGKPTASWNRGLTRRRRPFREAFLLPALLGSRSLGHYKVGLRNSRRRASTSDREQTSTQPSITPAYRQQASQARIRVRITREAPSGRYRCDCLSDRPFSFAIATGSWRQTS